MCIQVYSSRLLVGVKGYGETHKLFGDKILKIPQPTNKKCEAIMYRHEIDIEDLRGLI